MRSPGVGMALVAADGALLEVNGALYTILHLPDLQGDEVLVRQRGR